MKTQGRCIVCSKLLQQRKIPSEYTVVYREFMHVFTEYLRPKDSLSSVIEKLSIDFHENIFPFCKECKQAVAKLHKKYCQLQSGLKGIKKFIAVTQSRRILYEKAEKDRLQSSSETDTQSEGQIQQEPAKLMEVKMMMVLSQL